jgi:hypothetical protein
MKSKKHVKLERNKAIKLYNLYLIRVFSKCNCKLYNNVQAQVFIGIILKILHVTSSNLKKLGPGVYSASNRNEYQKHKNNNVSV